ncbi:SpaA isopeptide-forming pilin-related protein [Agathobaculum sp.]|uniref:SpaA isopeptide-forming pilin-related protein n=1 Tax=Agathobaculum sp. TaxID=2048138 RepID=UPI002A83D35C|nr:SpaA isopeptide-forming pilin-related protein [Agathobaculum sp.]MDY3617827.1 SpaA isopeptide-forming pilin-related protein [Agathobaculum sp.]
MRLHSLFRRISAAALAACLLAGVLPVTGAAAAGIIGFDGQNLSVDTAAARLVTSSIDLSDWELPQEALAMLDGYTIADATQRDNVVYVAAYRFDGSIQQPQHKFLTVVYNQSGEAVSVDRVNGAAIDQSSVVMLGGTAVQPDMIQADEAKQPEAAPQDGEKPAAQPEDNTLQPEQGGQVPVPSESEPEANDQQDREEQKGEEKPPDAPTEPQQVQPIESKPETEAKTEASTADNQQEQQDSSAAEPMAALFGTRVIGPRAVLSSGPDSGSAASGWTIAPGLASGYTFTVTGSALSETIKLYGENADPNDPAAQPLTPPVDPQTVFGVRYDCALDPQLSLRDAAGSVLQVDMESFGQVFSLGELGGGGDNRELTIASTGKYQGFAIGTIRVDKPTSTAYIEIADEAALRASFEAANPGQSGASIAQITGLRPWFWMSCRYEKGSGGHPDMDTVTLGGTTIELDWSNIDAQTPHIQMNKKEKAFDKDTRTITWSITLTPENGASLAGAVVAERLGDALSFRSMSAVRGNTAIDVTSAVSNPESTEPTYTFPADGGVTDGQNTITLGKNEAVELLVKTVVNDSFFMSHLNEQRAIITNQASVIKQDAEQGTITAEASANKVFDTRWLGKDGEYQAVDGNHASEIKWTIKLNGGTPVKLENVLVYDLLPSEMIFGENADVRLDGKSVLNAQSDVKPWYSVETITRQTILAGAPAALQAEIAALAGSAQLLIVHIPSLAAKQQNITFYTQVGPVFGSENQKTVNKAYMTFTLPGGSGQGGAAGEMPGATSPEVSYVQAAIAKTGSYDRSNRLVTWKISANSNRQALTGGVRIEDDLNNLYKANGWKNRFVDGSLYWSVENGEWQVLQQCANNQAPAAEYPEIPAYTMIDGKLTVYVREMNQQSYQFKFQTEVIGQNIFKNQMQTKLSNTASLVWDGRTVSHSAQVPVTSAFLIKESFSNNHTANGNGTPYEPADNTLWWKIQINADGRAMADPVDTNKGPSFVDTLPEGLTYAGYELYAASVTNYDNTNGYMGLLTPKKPLETSVTGGSYLAVMASGNTVTFQFNDPIEAAKNRADTKTGRYILFVKTKVASEKLSGIAAQKVKFPNTVTINGTDMGHALTATAKKTAEISRNHITKSGAQRFENGKAIYEADWTIDVNLDGKANGYTEPTVIDEFPEGMTLKQEGGRYQISIHKLDAARKNIVGDDLAYGEDGMPNGWTYVDGVFRFTLPNEADGNEQPLYSAYRICLTAEIDPNFAGTVVTNKVRCEAKEEQIGESAGDVKVRYYGAGVNGNWNDPPKGAKRLTLTKVSAAQQDLKLEGAEFDIYYSVNGTEYIRYGHGTTKSDGILKIAGLPADTQKIKLIETKAPEGYVLPANAETIFVFPEDTSAAELQISNQLKPSDNHNGGGGRPNKPDPEKPDGEVDIPDEERPLSPGEEGNIVDIPDEDRPQASGEDPVKNTVEIPDEDVPKASAGTETTSAKRLPQTGGLTAGILIPGGLLTSGLGLLLGRRKEDEE